ncbi:MAG: choice-of-anchor J domain-containing protein, partial [Chitinophagaceae bacterium]
MKQNFILSILAFGSLLAGLVHGCKKDSLDKPPAVIATSFTEEFKDVSQLETGGWVIKDNSVEPTPWIQPGASKGGPYPFFPAYSFTSSEFEFISAYITPTGTTYAVSSWLITPVLSLKNGDKISFYSRTDSGNVHHDRMQARMNSSTSADVGENPSELGGFTTILMDINSAQVSGGYPETWTKYEH